VLKQFNLQINVVINVASKTRHAFSNCCEFNFFRLFKIVVVYLAIFVLYLAKSFFRSTAIFDVYLAIFVVYLAKPLENRANSKQVNSHMERKNKLHSTIMKDTRKYLI